MFGFQYDPNYPGSGYSPPAGATYPRMEMAGQSSFARWLGAPSEPAFEMKQDYGNQNSTTLAPLQGTYVPAQTGLFGPLFGFQTPENSCAPPYGVGSMQRPTGPNSYGLDPTTSVGNNRVMAQGLSNNCPIIMNLPYPTTYP